MFYGTEGDCLPSSENAHSLLRERGYRSPCFFVLGSCAKLGLSQFKLVSLRRGQQKEVIWAVTLASIQEAKKLSHPWLQYQCSALQTTLPSVQLRSYFPLGSVVCIYILAARALEWKREGASK